MTNKNILLRIISIIMLMEMLDATVLNTSIPKIASSLHVNPIQLKEILTIYFLALGIFIPVSGWAADRFGEKPTLLFAITLFTISSVACGLSVNLLMLTGFRFCQGVGGAFLMPIGRQIIFRTFSGTSRVQAMAKINIMTYVGLLLGPVVGGAITTYFHWRWIFFLNLPIGVLGFLLVLHFLPVIREKVKTGLDFLGFALIGISLGSLLFLLDILLDFRVSTTMKIALLSITIIGLVIYIPYSKTRTHPLINLNLFKQGHFKYDALGSFLARLTLTTQPFLVPLLLQTGYSYTPMQSGLFTLPVFVSTFTVFLFLSKIFTRFDHRRLLLWNTAMLVLIFCSYSLQTFNQLWISLLLLQQIIIGALLPIQGGLMNANTYSDLSAAYATQGVAFNSGIIQISGSFGIALASLTMIAIIGPSDLQHHVPLIAFRIVFIVQSLYSIAAFWCFYQRKSHSY